MYRLAETLNSFEFHHLQNEFWSSETWSFTILSWSALNPAHVASVDIFLSKSELSINAEIYDLLTNYFSFIFVLSISHLNLLKSNVVKNLAWMSNIFASSSVFLTSFLTSAIVFSTALRAAVVAKPIILCILPLILVIFAL